MKSPEQGRLDFEVKLTPDEARAQVLIEVMTAIQDVLRERKPGTQYNELIDEYVKAWGEYAELTGADNLDVVKGGFLPEDYTMDLVVAAGQK